MFHEAIQFLFVFYGATRSRKHDRNNDHVPLVMIKSS